MAIPDVPAEFKLIARNVAVGVTEFVHSMDDLVSHALIGIDKTRAAAVRPFIKSLLAQNLHADGLAEFWSTLPSGIYFKNGESVRKFLQALLVRIEKEPYLTD